MRRNGKKKMKIKKFLSDFYKKIRAIFIIITEFHVEAGLNKKSEWKRGVLFYDGKTCYYMLAGYFVFCLIGYAVEDK